MKSAFRPSITTTRHGIIQDQEVKLHTLVNTQGMAVQVSELGAHLISVTVPDEQGNAIELTLGYENFDDWKNNSTYFGASCGRFGNRIAHGKFSLNGNQYTLANNNDPGGIPCHLHGGPSGFHSRIWQSTSLVEDNRQGVAFTLLSPDGDEGYPGNLEVTVTYWLNDDNELTWHAEATTDQPTLINLINHTYWNLSGDLDSPILDHEIQIHANHFLPTNSGMIPTGEIRNVSNSPMDFTQSKVIGQEIDTDYEPLTLAGGYDHCWVLADSDSTLKPAALVKHLESGRSLEIHTDQPGVQFYTGNFLSGNHPGRKGCHFPRQSGLCLETEGFPDAPNHPNFPSCILNPGETYQHTLVMTLR